MKTLVIGTAGFAGQYLLSELAQDKSVELHATKLEREQLTHPTALIHDLDIRDREAVHRLIHEIKPDFVYHLAALSSVKQSWEQPGLTVDINVKGSLHVLEAIRDLPQKPRVLLIGSGEEYGFSAQTHATLSEDTLPRPGNIYAVTKAAQNLLGVVYARAYQIPVILVRAFNHIGPGQEPQFVVSDFCRQIAMIEKGQAPPILCVGNLSAERDFCDVRDIVRAYTLLLRSGAPGETYNIGSGRAVSIQKILDTLLTFTDHPITVQVEPQRYRPVDIPCIQADIRKLSAVCHWEPRYSLDQSLQDTLNHWRTKG